MSNKTILGIDMGGTNIRAGLVYNKSLSSIISKKINANASAEDVLQQLFFIIDSVINDTVTSIGIGIPGLVDAEEQLIYDVINIPSWKKVPLQKLMEERYKIPVLTENDANCFALGELYFGKGINCNSMICLTIGTGLGSGIIINKKLYTGRTGGAGEFGMVSYLNKCYEYYASGQFFKNVYKTEGEIVFKNAQQGNAEALRMYKEMGHHLGNAIKMMLYALDVELIVLGGSVRHAFAYFSETMWQQVRTIAFQKAIEIVQIKVSELENAGILGAAALFLNQK